jgi:large subunit ribosomal protein L22
METSKAKLRFLRMSPRKVRLVVDLVRGLDVDKALPQLRFSKKDAARPVRKLIESAVANAVNNHKLTREALYIESIAVDQGPTIKRFKPRAFGRATMIRKRMSHVTLTLAEREGLAKMTPVDKKKITKKMEKPAVKKAGVVKAPIKKAVKKAPTKKSPASKTEESVESKTSEEKKSNKVNS